MNKPALVCVVTTIQEPTACMRRLDEILLKTDSRLIIIGDRKGPARFDLRSADLFTLEQQSAMPFQLAAKLPTGHYARKNLGYLEAIRRGASCIYETDDDNMPANSWTARTLNTTAQPWNRPGWANTYRNFTCELIWPRGFPLAKVNDPATFPITHSGEIKAFDSPIQQGLADGAADVDAVWRLVLDREFRFEPAPSLWLAPGTWCPFNSQSTWWWPEAYPLLYLPSNCPFRMTDIWRSFVAQRCLWELGKGVVFHGAEVIQQRNIHNYLADFADEVPGYLHNEKIAACLADLKLRHGPSALAENLVACYENLTRAGFFPADESALVSAWLRDLDGLLGRG